MTQPSKLLFPPIGERLPPRALRGWEIAAWLAAALALVLFAAAALHFGPHFGYDYEIDEMPILAYVAAYVAAGLLFLIIAWLTWRAALGNVAPRWLLALVVATGLCARLILLFSEPILEDDYQRYLWDGAVTASGLNPYAVAPEDAAQDWAAEPWRRLAEASGVVNERVNHPELRTVYPPVAQAAFVLAHVIAPFDLLGWRLVCLLADLVSLALLIALLRTLDRSPLWLALYWCNPIVIKELFNSAHMEAILVPALLGALLLAVRTRYVASAGMLAVAAGIKIWPVLLLPSVLRPLIATPARLVTALILVALIGALCAIPILWAGLDEGSGLVAYASGWQTNSALFPALATGLDKLLNAVRLTDVSAGLAARAIVLVLLAMLAVRLTRNATPNPHDIVNRFALLVLAVYLLVPAQFPWYAVWVLAVLPLVPLLAIVGLAVVQPLYYMAFHFMAHGPESAHKDIVVWVIWIPVWGLLVLDLLAGRFQISRE